MSDVSKRIATIESAPFASASSTMRCITCSRLSTSAFVIPFSSPPRIDFSPAPICEPMLRERTVSPITSPSTSVISEPASSFVVEINNVCLLSRRLLLELPDLRPRARVQHLLLRQPRTPGLRHAHLDVLQRAQLVRVGVDSDLHAGLARKARVRVTEVEPVRLRVDLEEGSGLSGLLDDARDVHVGRAAN